MKNFFLSCIFSIFLISIPVISQSQNPVNPTLAFALQNRIDSFITQNNLPGISVSIMLPGNQMWNGASGQSDIYSHVPMDTSFLFQLASVNKMYVAAMIFQMKEQGLLSLEDTVGMYLSPMTNVPPGTTISNLLQHKSGIADIADYAGITNEWFLHPDSVWPHLQTIETFVDTVIFEQGQFFDYSNTNYILLGMIIEQITGNTFASELRNRFCIPFGLTQSFFAPDDSIAGSETPGWTSFTTPNVYNTNASAILNDCSASMFFTSGAMIAKPADVARFTRLLWSGQIVSDSSLNMMKQCSSVNFGGGCNGYGYGTMRYVFGGKYYYGHAGDVNGFTQLSIHQQEDSVTITISVNRNNAPRGPMADELLSLVTQLANSVSKNEIDEVNLFVYPNPATDIIKIQIDSPGNNIFDLSVLNLYGSLVLHKEAIVAGKNENCQIDVSDLLSGIYIIKLTSDKKEYSKKIVIQDSK